MYGSTLRKQLMIQVMDIEEKQLWNTHAASDAQTIASRQHMYLIFNKKVDM